MRSWILILALAASAFAEEAKPTIEALQIEIEYLKAQLALANQQLEIATLPAVMKTRLAAIEAGERLKAAKSIGEPGNDAKPASPQAEKK